MDVASSAPVPVLSGDEIDQFLDRGFVHLSAAFPSSVASACRESLAPRISDLGVDLADDASWPQKLGLTDVYTAEHGEPWTRVLTKRLKGALNDLCGEDSWEDLGCGWWVLSFPQRASPCGSGACEVEGSWHVDGSHFKHRLHSREVGLVLLMLFSDVAQGGGGTAVKVSSHKRVGRIVADAGAGGIDSSTLMSRLLEDGVFEEQSDILELVGLAGDVFLLHPFTLHARTRNSGENIRYLCHPCISLRQDLQLDKLTGYSVLEQSMQRIADESCPHDSELDGAKSRIRNPDAWREEMASLLGFSQFKKTRFA